MGKGESGMDEGRDAVMADLFEESFIEVIDGLAEKGGLKKGAFSRLVWPDSTPLVARNRWANMRTPLARNGRPIACNLSDAYRLAKALGLQVAYVALQAENLADRKYEQMKLAESEGRGMEADTAKLGRRRHSRTAGKD
jgi:hypothetical protein